jgi:Fe-S cluster assembly protein SufB
VKFEGQVDTPTPGGPSGVDPEPTTGHPLVVDLAVETENESRTRDRVCRTILEQGPVTASELGRTLGLTAAAVRRHLDCLLQAGVIIPWTGAISARGRGRPARRFVLTDAGHMAMTSTYDDLAASALRFLGDLAGPSAVRRFADARVAELESRYRPSVDAAGGDRVRRAQALADALSRDGFAASTRPLRAGSRAVGTQLCQGHCPVQHVAAEFPELCEAETEAFSRLLGVHVQRLATLAHGEHVCTTHVPGGGEAALPDHGTRPTPLAGEDLPMTTTAHPELDGLGRYEYGWADPDLAGATARRGLSEDVVRNISAMKNEPEWMLRSRLKGLRLFGRKPMPNWGSDLTGINFDSIKYFVRSTERQAASWEDLPEDIRRTYDRLGIPEAEKQRLVAGVAAQYESEVVYHQIREDLARQGVIFLDTDTALREHPELFREYFASVIPVGDNKFAALNTAVWSGGSFIYVPPGVHVDIPLQAYFRINTENMGQFERTLIIADEGSHVHYVEGCTAPIYSSDSLHSAVVEIIVKKDARVRYTTIQNWSNNVYNLVTKRAVAHAGATMEWIDGNIGSKVTMKYPAVYLVGEHARGETLSIAFSGEGQHQDAGAKMVHAAPHTSSTIVSKSVARGGGRTSYRGLVQVLEGAHHSASTVRCDALLVDTVSRSDTYPYVDVREDDVAMGHEATVSKVSEDQLFYLMSRGLSEEEAMAMIVRGFVEPIARELPMEYALELNRLIELQMEGAVG